VLIIAAVAFVLRPSSSDTSAGAPASTTPGTIVPGAGDLQATQMAARAVCVGNQASIPGAGAYPGAAGAPHPIVVARDEIEDASLTVPSAWTRSERDALDRPVELILCSRVERLGGSQNCGGYGGVRVDVQDATWTIEVRAASTGEIVGQTVLPGTEGCPGGVMVAPGEPQVLANRPNRSEVNTFVESYVMAP
jgi:hypothetical protein